MPKIIAKTWYMKEELILRAGRLFDIDIFTEIH